MVKIVYSDDKFVARSSGLWFWKRIEIGRLFHALPVYQQLAVLHHEQAHHDLGHILERYLWMFSLRFLDLESLFRSCRKQEFEADARVARIGHRDALISRLACTNNPASRLHPSDKERIERLKGEGHVNK